MIEDPRCRPDYSRFLVHLTRSYERSNPLDNLVNILKTKKIEARNYHCLFSPKIKRSSFSKKLKGTFKTVCFTETPFDQIHKMTSETYDRQIKLRPFGLVFWRHQLIEMGANPAIYINKDGPGIREYLISEFNRVFAGVKALRELGDKFDSYYEIVKYYSLINVIAQNHDYSWEREWRFNGDFKFKFSNVVAIVTESPDDFIKRCNSILSPRQNTFIKRIPIISPTWGYEELIEEMSKKLWVLGA